jgi:hypothetical membrane protein
MRSVEFWGGLLWIASVQFFIVQVIVQLAWPVPYNPIRDPISDLGRLTCTATECSPLHGLMNASFIALGLCMLGGAIAAEASSPRVTALSRAAAAILTLSGLGTVGVGLVPNDTIVWLHTTLAAFAIVGGNTGTALTGWALRRSRRMTVVGALGVGAGILGWVMTLVLGAAHLGATALLPVQGLLERGAAYPMLLALIVSGGALVRGDWVDRVVVPRRPA